MKNELDKALEVVFKPNHPYELYIEFNHGKLTACNIYDCKPGQGTWNNLKQIDGVWHNWGKPIEFGEINISNWSHGCKGSYIFIKQPTYEDFKASVYNASRGYLKAYELQLDNEAKSTSNAVSMVSLIYSTI